MLTTAERKQIAVLGCFGYFWVSGELDFQAEAQMDANLWQPGAARALPHFYNYMSKVSATTNPLKILTACSKASQLAT